MAKLKKRKRLFKGLTKDRPAKLRGFHAKQRSHPKFPMPIPESKIVKDPKVEAALDEASAWA